MKKAATIIIPVLLLILAAAQFSSCEKFVLPDISVTPDTLRFSARADSAEVRLSTNVITKAEADDDFWITTWPDWFDTSSNLMVFVRENTDSLSRTGILYFKSEAIQKKLVVIQEGI